MLWAGELPRALGFLGSSSPTTRLPALVLGIVASSGKSQLEINRLPWVLPTISTSG